MPPEEATAVAETTSSNDAASCKGLVKIYWTATGEVNALTGIDASFPEGAITAVVGPSGSGKSSLLRILAAIDRPTAGQVMIGGRDVSSLPAWRRRRVRRRVVGYMFQRPADNLIPYLNAYDHLVLAGRLRGGFDPNEADELLEVVGLTDRAKHRPHQMSGGEQQRLALASAAIGKPALVVADEPTAELDSGSGQALMELVRSLARRGVTFLSSTHDPIVAAAADRTLYLRHGALEAEADAERHQARALSVIDTAGRIQLPPGALRLFPGRRAVITVDEDGVRIDPP
ncbi:MAG TPA: ATP-binding cassette domain-containing protein [Actinomycetota bacterium]